MSRRLSPHSRRATTQRALGGLLALGVLLGLVPSAWGQASESEMRWRFPMPPSEGYAQTKHFAFAGDYQITTLPPLAVPAQVGAPDTYTYSRYTGVAGKQVTLFGRWGDTDIGERVVDAQGRERDNCGHAHNSYGVWGRFVVTRGGPFPYVKSSWHFLGGGGMSGERTADGRCVLTRENPLTSIDSRFGWGDDAVNLDFRKDSTVAELVMATASNTHGWGSCVVPPNMFRACQEPSWVYAFTRS